MADLKHCCFTTNVSMTPTSRTSTTTPFSASIPMFTPSPALACLLRSSVITRTTLTPQFIARTRGITSNAAATALYPYCIPPSIDRDFSSRRADTSISTAPPPGTRRGSRKMLRATQKASCKFRSISLSASLLAPRNKTVHAFGSSHSSMYVKYSSPIFSTLNSPHFVPTSFSVISSVRLTMVAPVTLAIRLLSVLRALRITETLPFNKKCWARSETPFSVTTTSGLCFKMSSHIFWTSSSSCFSNNSQSSSRVISTLVADSDFLYSSVQSRRITRGFSMRRRIFG
mmetsp:Transcript_12850/g.30812  ORF Transcript_12850/g.30812 Transcript_12850/m.30812 type:complete len:286 (-) Transcript_12850:724-1581(-)